MSFKNTAAVVLAAGRSTRFNRSRSKLITTICGQPMINFPLKALKSLGIPVTVVLCPHSEKTKEAVKSAGMQDIDFVIQEKPLGTGDALAATRKSWANDHILVINGDMPLIEDSDIKKMITAHEKNKATVSFAITTLLNPTGYGRVITNESQVRIVEDRDCSPEERMIPQVNAGIYLFKRSFLEENISLIDNTNATGEFYVVNLINMASEQGRTINRVHLDPDAVRGVNTLEELWAAEHIKQSDLIRMHMERGVFFESPQSNRMDLNIEIGPDSFIGSGVHLVKGTKIGSRCRILSSSILQSTIVGDGTTIFPHTVIENSYIGNECNVGPFSFVCDNSTIRDGVSIGNFVKVQGRCICNDCTIKPFTELDDVTLGGQTPGGCSIKKPEAVHSKEAIDTDEQVQFVGAKKAEETQKTT